LLVLIERFEPVF